MHLIVATETTLSAAFSPSRAAQISFREAFGATLMSFFCARLLPHRVYSSDVLVQRRCSRLVRKRQSEAKFDARGPWFGWCYLGLVGTFLTFDDDPAKTCLFDAGAGLCCKGSWAGFGIVKFIYG
jgi:hypothetical protein